MSRLGTSGIRAWYFAGARTSPRSSNGKYDCVRNVDLHMSIRTTAQSRALFQAGQILSSRSGIEFP